MKQVYHTMTTGTCTYVVQLKYAAFSTALSIHKLARTAISKDEMLIQSTLVSLLLNLCHSLTDATSTFVTLLCSHHTSDARVLHFLALSKSARGEPVQLT